MYQARNALINLINIALAIISVFLLLRIGLQMIGANSATPFVAWIYNIASALMTPFAGIVGNISLPGVGVVDMVAIVSIVAYLLLGSLLIAIINAVARTAENRYHDRPLASHHHDVRAHDEDDQYHIH